MLSPPKSNPTADATPALAMDRRFSVNPGKSTMELGRKLIRRGTMPLVAWLIGFNALIVTGCILVSDQRLLTLNAETAQLGLGGVTLVVGVGISGLLTVLAYGILGIFKKNGGGT